MTPFRKKVSVLALALIYSSALLFSSFLTPSPTRAIFNLCDIYQVAGIIPFPDAFKKFLGLQRPWYDPNICDFSNKVYNSPDDEIFGERYTYAQVNWISHSIFISLMPAAFGPSVFDQIFDLFTQNSAPPDLAVYAKFGLPGLLLGSISEMYQNAPASGIDSVRSALAKYNLASPVHAQGYGYQNIDGIRILWVVSRNTTYFLMVILLLAASFLIMFRVKINPQTVVSLQLMIPKIIITLLLVTFSYAIAGFVIDMIYVAITFIITAVTTFDGGQIFDNAQSALQFFTSPGFGRIFWFYFITLLLFIILSIGAYVIGPIPALVLFIVTLFLLIRIWWMLIKTYLQLILAIIAGPWQIMLGLLPGQQGFGAWFRNIIAQASVFVVVPVMFMISLILMSTPMGGMGSYLAAIFSWVSGFFPTGTWDPGINAAPLSAPGNFPQLPFNSSPGMLMYFMIAFATLSLIPKAAELVRDALKIPAFKYGTAFGEALGPVTGPTSSIFAARGKANLETGAASGNWVQQLKGAVQQGVGGAVGGRR